MKKILHVISSPRGAASFSIKLGNAVVEKIQAEQPGSTVKEYNLVDKQFPHLEEAQLASFFTPVDSRSPENLEAIRHSDEAVRDIQEADIIVIGAPLYNFAVPSTLKAWIDHIVRPGLTFSHSDKGVEGLIHGKKVYIAMSSGGIYSEGPAQAYDFVVPFLKHVLGFIGLTDVTVFRVEGTAIPGKLETALERGINSIILN